MENSTIENIVELTKERLINFSIKDFFANNEIMADKNYIIDFERERIKLIAKPISFEENTIDKYRVLNYIFKSKATIGNDLNDSTEKDLKDTFNNVLKNSVDNNSIDSPNNNGDTISSFSEYLYKLRKGTINPEKLKISDKIPNIKECLKQPLFNHPLLGRCKVIQRTENNVIVRNKSGLMRIRI